MVVENYQISVDKAPIFVYKSVYKSKSNAQIARLTTPEAMHKMYVAIY